LLEGIGMAVSTDTRATHENDGVAQPTVTPPLEAATGRARSAA
jgi:hypothetical protein